MSNIRIINPEKSIPYVLILPDVLDEDTMLVVEANNLESTNDKELIDSAINSAKRLYDILCDNNVPVLVPVIPSVEGGIPYYQQLSKECFTSSKDRIDVQVRNAIEDAKTIVLEEYKTNLNEKIFLNGYSSSGVFAQRFALIHPDIVDTLCVGGAIGSIPVLNDSLSYPLGVKDYINITGKQFDIEDYKHIKFRYYAGEFEDKNKSNKRYDENGEFAPVHDMSYFDRSVPREIGIKQRELFGRDIFLRSNNIIDTLKDMNLDIEMTIFKGYEFRYRNDYF